MAILDLVDLMDLMLTIDKFDYGRVKLLPPLRIELVSLERGRQIF